MEEIENEDIQTKYGIKPHGFCLGCMVNCHEGHEVNELYCKLNFRCDCGNSHMPESCQLNDQKDYSNPGNRYTRNYFDLYCHCNMPHNQDLIDEEKVSFDFLILNFTYRCIWFNALLARIGSTTITWTLWCLGQKSMKVISWFVELVSIKKVLNTKVFWWKIRNIFIKK